MKTSIDMDAILSPIAGENPAGENLRYAEIYDEIQEARRSDDTLERGDWQRELKKADWNRVISLSVEALTTKSKDLQMAAWLTEALTQTEGFTGLFTGLRIINRFLSDFWDHLYPEAQGNDLDFRAGRIEFLNNVLGRCVKQIPLTDPAMSPGYSWFQWQDSRQVGYETDAAKADLRKEFIAEGKLTAEEFDSAVAHSSKAFYERLAKDLACCLEEFALIDQIVDEKFGKDAPRLAELRKAFADCNRVVSKIIKQKRELEPEEETASQEKVVGEVEQTKDSEIESKNSFASSVEESERGLSFPLTDGSETILQEHALWKIALGTLKSSGIKKALEQLLAASCGAPSIRQKNRYGLLMAKLCLKAERPDLARPIVEKLYALIEELNLERWESPLWIAEVLDALYQCLTAGEPSAEDKPRAQELFQKLCTADVTKAMMYRH
jgi:type VI secretion system protein ImpA